MSGPIELWFDDTWWIERTPLYRAAPELLEALKTLVDDEESAALFSQRIQKARAAIAKAEGRAE